MEFLRPLTTACGQVEKRSFTPPAPRVRQPASPSGSCEARVCLPWAPRALVWALRLLIQQPASKQPQSIQSREKRPEIPKLLSAKYRHGRRAQGWPGRVSVGGPGTLLSIRTVRRGPRTPATRADGPAVVSVLSTKPEVVWLPAPGPGPRAPSGLETTQTLDWQGGHARCACVCT